MGMEQETSTAPLDLAHDSALSQYLREIEAPFPHSQALLEDIGRLCDRSHTPPPAPPPPSCWAELQELLRHIEQVEEAHIIAIRKSRQSSVTIGHRRVAPPPAEPPLPWNEASAQRITSAIEQFVAALTPVPPVHSTAPPTPPLAPASPAFRARAQSASEILRPSRAYSEAERRPYIDSRMRGITDNRKTKILSSVLEELGDGAPHEQLLHVFARHQRATEHQRNAWTQYLNESCVELPTRADRRYSLRYRDRDTLYQLEAVQQSFKQALSARHTIKVSPCPEHLHKARPSPAAVLPQGQAPPQPLPPPRKPRSLLPTPARPRLELPKRAPPPPPAHTTPIAPPQLIQVQEEPIIRSRLSRRLTSRTAAAAVLSVPTDLREMSGSTPSWAPKPSPKSGPKGRHPPPLKSGKRSWFTSAGPSKGSLSPTPASALNCLGQRIRGGTVRDPLKAREKTRKALRKQRTLLEKEFLLCGMRIREARLKEKEHRRSSKDELAKIRSYHQLELERAFRQYAIHKLLKLRAEIALQDHKSHLINAAFKTLKGVLRALEAATAGGGGEDGANGGVREDAQRWQAYTVDAICQSERMLRLQRMYKTRAKQQKRSHKDYQALLKAQSTLLTSEYRQKTLCNLLACLQPHRVVGTFYPYELMEQNILDALLLDQRGRTGMKILRLQQAIEATDIHEIPPHEVVDFLQDLVDDTAAECGVPDDHLDRLRLGVGRAVFPLLLPLLWPLNREENEAHDAQFEAQQAWLRHVPAGALDPILERVVGEQQLFVNIIVHALENIALQVVPSDMLMVLYRVMEMIHSLAQGAEGEASLGADELFPLWLYVTIHAHIADLHSHLFFMERFATPEDSMTQLGYCLTTFQACVAHVRKIQPKATETSSRDDGEQEASSAGVVSP